MTRIKASWLVAIAVPLYYLAAYVPYGMDTTDFGYFYAYAWRILEGQVPYRDFHYIKPALPLYWHAFWLGLAPAQWQVLAGKAGFMFTMLASSWLGALYLGRIFRLQKLGCGLPLLATCAFIFGTHTFPQMPWHTADGVLFSSAALFCAALGWPCAAGILAACASLCKQSFLLVPPAILLFIWFWRQARREIAWFTAGWLGFMAVFFIWLAANGAFGDFRAMTIGQLDIREALDAGILIYLRQNWLPPLIACLPFLLFRLLQKNMPQWLSPCYCYLVVLGLWYIGEVWLKKTWIGFGLSWPTLFMLLGAACLLFPKAMLEPLAKAARPHGPAAGLFAALVAAWSVAISGGYKIPAFFAAPLVFSFFLTHARLGGNVRKLAWATLLTGLVMFGYGYQYPYVFPVRPLEKAWLAHDAGQVYPKASGVMVDADMLARLRELRDLRARYGPAYKTLPGFSFAYFLNDDRPALRSDWLIDWEINGEVDRLYRELLDKRLTVFMERDQLNAERADNYERAGYGVPRLVRENWRIVEETPHFVVFKPPEDK